MNLPEKRKNSRRPHGGCCVILSSLDRPGHRRAVIRLINEYRTGPMGGPLAAMTREASAAMIALLRSHSFSRIFLARAGKRFVGLLVAFVTASTFAARPVLNVHDLVVTKNFRRRGVGGMLLAAATEYAQAGGCCRLTLEVRVDNADAQSIYRTAGFAPCRPAMEFWRKELSLREETQGSE